MNPTTPIVFVACTALLSAQQRISLDGTWQIRPEVDAAAAVDYRDVEVPAAFETALGIDFDGVARYRRLLPMPQRAAKRVSIEFAAVATHARVYCNGIEVGEHLGGWTPFRVDITAALRPGGEPVLEVVVDEKVGHNTQGFLPIIQPHFGGIWQGVTLCLDDGPSIDRLELFSAGGRYRDEAGQMRGEVRYRVPLLGQPAAGSRQRLHVELIDDAAAGTPRVLASYDLPGNDTQVGSLRQLPAVRPWSPRDPVLYTLRWRLVSDGVELDRVERRIGFRSVRADGTRVLWNDAPLQLRGILHWGYSPPALAPPSDPAHWRPQLEYFQSLGFNCIKCCLWMPPRGFYELCDELGMLVWQEYPTWHPQMDQAHKQELLREYREFFALDRNHPSVGLRSITCETGPGADLDVVTALFEACKAAVGDTLVVDDSSWIGWQRITDFWDEHPYGNNSWFPGRIAHFQRHIEQHGAKPLLLGECFAADTWVDRAAWLEAHGEQELWWRPLCWSAQRDAERWLVDEFGQATLDSLQPNALAFGMQNRKFQIEQLRLKMPDAGYVVSVARDFQKARMGLYDDLDRPKWTPADWAWHGDTMLCLDLEAHERVLDGEREFAPIVVSHWGSEPLRGELIVRNGDGVVLHRQQLELAPGTNSAAIAVRVPRPLDRLALTTVHAQLTGSHPTHSEWQLRSLPAAPPPERRPRTALDLATLDELEAGASVLLEAAERPDARGNVRTESMWFLKGAPFTPPHPVHELVPAEFLLQAAGFELESGRVIPWAPFRDQVDAILAFWETHDIADVRMHLLAFDTRVGKGRLLVTCLDLDASPAGPVLRDLLFRHLESGPPPAHALTPATITAMRQKLDERTIDLPTWRFRIDPADAGRDGRWFDPATDVTTATWRDLQAGSHWENQGEDLRPYTGVAWYRIDVDVPESWRGLAARAVFDGVDDSFELWLNGEYLAAFGDPVKKTTIWLEQQICELGEHLRPGRRNTIVLRVVDHAGAGGLWRPARLTTGPVGVGQQLLR